MNATKDWNIVRWMVELYYAIYVQLFRYVAKNNPPDTATIYALGFQTILGEVLILAGYAQIKISQGLPWDFNPWVAGGTVVVGAAINYAVLRRNGASDLSLRFDSIPIGKRMALTWLARACIALIVLFGLFTGFVSESREPRTQ